LSASEGAAPRAADLSIAKWAGLFQSLPRQKPQVDCTYFFAMKKPLFALSLLVLVVTGCAKSNNNVEYEREKVSTVPWNKPAKWEGGGALGGAGGGGYR
jgi:hypothetical protein